MDLTMYDLTEEEERYVKMPHPITLKLWDDEDGRYYIAKIPLLRGCMTDGETVKEALTEILDAKVAWVAAALEGELVIPIPENDAVIVELLGEYTEDEKAEMKKSVDVFEDMVLRMEESKKIVPFKKK